jgi:hypothetical protein
MCIPWLLNGRTEGIEAYWDWHHHYGWRRLLLFKVDQVKLQFSSSTDIVVVT